MKKILRRIVALAVIALILRYTGLLGTISTSDNEPTNNPNGTVIGTSGEVKEEVTEDDIKMIEDFLDEIVEAVEKEENK